ncbi:MAG: SHOCT domain-containing protein [Marmoricola sp.]
MMSWYQGGFGTGGWIAMVAMMTLFWGAVVAVGLILLRGRDSDSRAEAPSHAMDRTCDPGPLDILDERFARGEMERDEYEARKSALQGDRA